MDLTFRPTISISGNSTATDPSNYAVTIFESESLIFQPFGEAGLKWIHIQSVTFETGSNSVQFSLGTGETLPAGLIMLWLQLTNAGVATAATYDVTFGGIVLDEANVSRNWSAAVVLTLAEGMRPLGIRPPVQMPVTSANRLITFVIALEPPQTKTQSSVDELTLFLNDVVEVVLASEPPLIFPGIINVTFFDLEEPAFVGSLSLGSMQSMLPGLLLPAFTLENIGPAADVEYEVTVAGTVKNGQDLLLWFTDPELLVKSTLDPGGGGDGKGIPPATIFILAQEPGPDSP